VAVIQEAWIGGVSTRRVDELVQAMGLAGISKSQVSKLCKEIDDRVNAFLDRPLEGEWPYPWLDATYLKVRDGGRIVSVAAIIAVAVTTDGRREIVGLGLAPSEAEPFWSGFLKGLVRRGLTGVKLVISDAHDGLRHAITRVLAATWQRCRVHWIRNALAHVPKGQHTHCAPVLPPGAPAVDTDHESPRTAVQRGAAPDESDPACLRRARRAQTDGCGADPRGRTLAWVRMTVRAASTRAIREGHVIRRFTLASVSASCASVVTLTLVSHERLFRGFRLRTR
jgi:hypothetical protein